jgi:hypothetical protein
MTELEKEMLAALKLARLNIHPHHGDEDADEAYALINEVIRKAESQKDDPTSEDTRSARAAKGRAR